MCAQSSHRGVLQQHCTIFHTNKVQTRYRCVFFTTDSSKAGGGRFSVKVGLRVLDNRKGNHNHPWHNSINIFHLGLKPSCILWSLIFFTITVTTLETTNNFSPLWDAVSSWKTFFFSTLPSRDLTALKHVLWTSDHYRSHCPYGLYLRSDRSTWFLSLYRLVLFTMEAVTAWGLRAKRWQDILLSQLSCVRRAHHASSTTPPEQLPWSPAFYCHFGWRVEKCSATGGLSDCTAKNVVMPSPGLGMKWSWNQDLALFAFPHLHRHWPGCTLAHTQLRSQLFGSSQGRTCVRHGA